MKRVIIVGASSGIGMRVATDFARRGWRVGIAARREERLKEIKERYPEQIEFMVIDVAAPDAVERFNELIRLVGGMDYFLYAAGCGWHNPELEERTDTQAINANVLGFTRITNAAYKYYKNAVRSSRGHIAAITSIAGTKGIGVCAVYSASKRYQWTYLQALDQLARLQHVNVSITDIRPGFVDTALLDPDRNYPMKMTLDHVAPRVELAMLTERRVVVIDSRWAAVTAIWRMMPSCLWRRIPLDL